MRIRRRVILAQQVLPAAGAGVTSAYFDLPVGVSRLVFYATYTSVGANGRPGFAVLWSNLTELVSREVVIDETTFAVGAGPNGTFQYYPSLPTGVAPGAGLTAEFALEWDATGGKRQVALFVAEVGDLPNPGTIDVAMTGS